MITRDEILELAEQILKVDGIRDDGSFSGFYGTTENIILFARTINDRGYNVGYDNGMVDYRELKKTGATEMKHTLLLLISNLSSVACVIAAAVLAIGETEGWGFFLIVALLTSTTLSTTDPL